MNLLTLLGALKAIGPVTAAIPEVKSLIDHGVSLLHPSDQPTAKAAYDDLIADNDEGFARLDAKLAEAEKR